jgi:hypothetical protein
MAARSTVSPIRTPTAWACRGIAYNRLADERSWKAMATFFEEIFGGA